MNDHIIPQHQIDWALEALAALDGSDPEMEHAKADDIILSLVPVSVRGALRAAETRAGSWWWA